MIEHQNHQNQSYGSKVVKVLRLRIELKINKLRQGPICNFRKINRGLTKKIGGSNVNTERLRGYALKDKGGTVNWMKDMG
jgi:hypothetical protein